MAYTSHHVLVLVLVLVVTACGSADDDASSAGDTAGTEATTAATTDGPGSQTGSEGGSSAADASAEGDTAGTTSAADADTTDPAECAGDYLCAADTEAACTADPCCVAAFGRGYEQDKTGWCLYDTPEYTGCSHAFNDACDFTGTIECQDALGITRLFEVENGCFPTGCLVARAPETNGAPCPE